ncbi:transposase family protein [Streptomyces bobili]|uniref:transposase family protein n=1 Tax=Streptomyces bobili TaxID=67280 RepID=UPI0037FF23D1
MQFTPELPGNRRGPGDGCMLSRSAPRSETTADTYSRKHRRHGVKLQVITDPAGTIVGIPKVLPGRTHNLTAARRHRNISTCQRLGSPVLAGRGQLDAGGTFATGQRRRPCTEPSPRHKSWNKSHARPHHPVERGMAYLTSRPTLRKHTAAPPGSPPHHEPSSPRRVTTENVQ